MVGAKIALNIEVNTKQFKDRIRRQFDTSDVNFPASPGLSL